MDFDHTVNSCKYCKPQWKVCFVTLEITTESFEKLSVYTGVIFNVILRFVGNLKERIRQNQIYAKDFRHNFMFSSVDCRLAVSQLKQFRIGQNGLWN